MGAVLTSYINKWFNVVEGILPVNLIYFMPGYEHIFGGATGGQTKFQGGQLPPHAPS